MSRNVDSQMPQVCIKLLVTNVPAMLLDLLRNVFATVSDIQVVERRAGQDLPSADPEPVDVILLGSSRTGGASSAQSIIEEVREQHQNAKIIILTQNPDYAETIALFRAGAKGILCNADLKFDLLCKCVRCVYKGEVWASNELFGYLVASLSHPKSREVTDCQGKPLLTTREQQVLHLLADGLSNSELAEVLKLSEHTVKNHLFRIYEKLGVSNRMEAVLYALTPRAQTKPSSMNPL